MRTRTAALGLAALVLVGATGCGGDDEALTRSASRRLTNQIAAVEFATAGGEYQAAREGLAEIRATTIRMADRGDISPQRVPRILEAIDELEVRLVRVEADR